MRRFDTLCLVLLFSTLAPTSSVQAQSFTDRSVLLGGASAAPIGPFGATSIDFNQDGLMDIYQSRNLYENRGADGFVNVYSESGLNEGIATFGAIFADYDSDGLYDVFFMDLIPPSDLYKQQADGTFRLMTFDSRLETEGVPVQGSLWLDYDNDGKLDLYVGGDGVTDLLFRNKDFMQFENAGQFHGLAVERGVYGAAASDFDRDGDMDIYIGACRPTHPEESRNMLWLNNNGVFEEAARGIEHTGDAWAVLWLDYDNDGWLDLYVVNSDGPSGPRSGKNLLYRNDGEGGFEEVGERAGVAGGEMDWGFGAAAADFDNDGWIDIYVLNRQGVADRLYRNNGDGTFTDVFASSGIVNIDNEAVTVADYDGDGFVDLFLGTSDGGVLYLNDATQNNWLNVSLQGVQANSSGIGARIELYRDGSFWQVREITAGEGMTSQNFGLSAHFGLGDVSRIDSVLVVWPGGGKDRIADVATNQRMSVVQGSYSTYAYPFPAPIESALEAYPNPFFDRVTITTGATKGASVSVRVFDMLGRLVNDLSDSTRLYDTRVVWDGRDRTGQRVPPGVYMISTRVGDQAQSGTIILHP